MNFKDIQVRFSPEEWEKIHWGVSDCYGHCDAFDRKYDSLSERIDFDACGVEVLMTWRDYRLLAGMMANIIQYLLFVPHLIGKELYGMKDANVDLCCAMEALRVILSNRAFDDGLDAVFASIGERKDQRRNRSKLVALKPFITNTD